MISRFDNGVLFELDLGEHRERDQHQRRHRRRSTSASDPNMVVPFIHRNGVMTAIGDAGGWATAINDAAQVTGFVYVEGGLSNHAFL